MDKELEDKLIGMSLAFILSNEDGKSNAIKDVVHLVKTQEQLIKDSDEEVVELKRKLIRKQVREYNENNR